MISRSKLISLIIAIAIIGINLTGCEVSPSTATPALPAGFAPLLVPDVELQGLLYVNQGTPFNFIPDNPAIIIPELSADSAQVWLGPDADSAGGSVTFTNEAYAQKVSGLLNHYKLPTWSQTTGRTVYAALSSQNGWSNSLNTRVQGQYVRMLSRYPSVQADFAWFPASPPLKPVGAGFINLNGGLLESVERRYNVSLSGYLNALRSAKISQVSFVGYAAQPIRLSVENLHMPYIQSINPALLAVGRSEYPGVAFAAFFDKAMRDAGFVAYRANNVDIYGYSVSDSILLVARKGNVVYAAVAYTKDTAESLLLSCF